jgi:hypothetical protein
MLRNTVPTNTEGTMTVKEYRNGRMCTMHDTLTSDIHKNVQVYSTISFETAYIINNVITHVKFANSLTY